MGKQVTTAGFTLLETVVSIFIMSAGLVGIYRIFSVSMDGFSRAATYEEAVVIGRNLSASVGVEIPLEEGSYRGVVYERFYWQLKIEPWRDHQSTQGEHMWHDIYEVRTAVTWDGARTFEIVTLKRAQSP